MAQNKIERRPRPGRRDFSNCYERLAGHVGWVGGRCGTGRTSRKLQESVFVWAIFRAARGCACVKKCARGLWALRIDMT